MADAAGEALPQRDWNDDHIVDAADKQALFSDSGVVAGDAGFTYDKTTNVLSLNGAANSLNLKGSATGDAVEVSATGADTDIIVKVTPKGLGYTQLGPDTYGIAGWGGENVMLECYAIDSGQFAEGIYCEVNAGDIAGAQILGMSFNANTCGNYQTATQSQDYLYGMQGGANSYLPSGLTLNLARGGDFQVFQVGTGTLTDAIAVSGYAQALHGTITNAYAIVATVSPTQGNGVVVNAYGLKVDDVTTGTTLNYSCYFGAGKYHFDGLTASAVTLTDASKNLTSVALPADATKFLNGVGAFSTPAGGVTSIATTSPITGGTITATGTLGLDVSVNHAFTAAQSITEAINATSTDGLSLINSTAATVGAQKWSPRTRWTGRGWQTGGSASELVDWIAEVQPVQGASHPTSNWVLSSQINGAGYSARLTINDAGTVITLGGSHPIITDGQSRITFGPFNSTLAFGDNSTNYLYYMDGSGLVARSNGYYAFSNSATRADTTVDTWLRKAAAATLQQGDANAASPVAQTLQAQGARSGTDSNVGGADYTVRSGNGTGTGTLSSLVLQSPVATASGTGAQTLTTGLAIKNGVAVASVYTVATLPTASTVPYGIAAVSDALTPVSLAAVVGGGAAKVIVYSNGSAWNVM